VKYEEPALLAAAELAQRLVGQNRQLCLTKPLMLWMKAGAYQRLQPGKDKRKIGHYRYRIILKIYSL